MSIVPNLCSLAFLQGSPGGGLIGLLPFVLIYRVAWLTWAVGKQLVKKYGSLQSLAQASREDLQTIKGIGRDKAVTLVAAFALARMMAKELGSESPVLDTPEAVADLVRDSRSSSARS